jgi:hypothetical protein
MFSIVTDFEPKFFLIQLAFGRLMPIGVEGGCGDHFGRDSFNLFPFKAGIDGGKVLEPLRVKRDDISALSGHKVLEVDH